MNEALKTEERAEYEDAFHYAIADRASTLRRRRGMTLTQCGAIMGVTESSASLKFSGKGKWSAWEVRRMADTFEVTVGVLYGDEPMPEPNRPATVTTLDTTKNANRVGPTGLEPMTSTV